jgi:hypothetical protein
MRRILLVLAVAAVMAAMVVTTALPAFAAVPSSNGNCLAQVESQQASSDGKDLGQATARNAQNNQGIGQQVSPIVTDPLCNPRP